MALRSYRKARYWLAVFAIINLVTWFGWNFGSPDVLIQWPIGAALYHYGRGMLALEREECSRDGRSI